MVRNEKWKRNVIQKINKKQEKKDIILENHYKKNTVKYKRPLLKIELASQKLQKAKHVDQLKTLIHQEIKIRRKFLTLYHSALFDSTKSATVNPANHTQLETCKISLEICDEFEYTDEDTNIWFVPHESAFCFHLDECEEILKKMKLDATTTNVKEEYKAAYEKYATVSLADQINTDLMKEKAEPEVLSSDQRESLNTAISLINLPILKRRDLLSLIDSYQSVVVGASRDENDAFTDVPLLLLSHLFPTEEKPGHEQNKSHIEPNVSSSFQNEPGISYGGPEVTSNSTKARPIRIVCSTPHFVTAQIAAKKLKKQLGDVDYSLFELDVGFVRKKHPETTAPILFCTNHQLIHTLLNDLALSQVSHIILDRAHHRDDMFDLLLVYMRQYLLSKRSDLKLIILSSPTYMDILSKHFQLPTSKLPSNLKSNPVAYLERILQNTNLPPDSNEYGNMKIIEKVFIKDYYERLEKHVNLLRLKGSHKAEVINNILNPELEGVHIGLLLSLLTQLVNSENSKVILVFLPNDEAIGKVYGALRSSADFPTDPSLKIIKYHSKITKQSRHIMNYQRQHKLLILATDTIEVLDRIGNVSHIVDCGCYEKTDFVAHFNIGVRELDWISKQIHMDRKSWCEKRSKCQFFTLTTSIRGTYIRGFCTSYLGRIRPDYLTFLISRLGIQNVAGFLEHLDIKPEHRSIYLAVKRLQILNILDASERLTPLGFSVSILPLPPHLARMAILGCLFSCVNPVLSIIAVLLTHDPFDETCPEPLSSLKAAQAGGSCSDHMVWVRVLDWYDSLTTESENTSLRSRCQSRGLLLDSLRVLSKVKRYLLEQLEAAGYVRCGVENVNAACDELVAGIVFAGLYPNVAVIGSTTEIRISKLIQVTIHPSSVHHANSSSQLALSCSKSEYSNSSHSKPQSSNNSQAEVKSDRHSRKKPRSLSSQSSCSNQTTCQNSVGFLAYSQCYGTDMGSPGEQIYIREVSPVSSIAVALFSHDFHTPKRKPNKFSVNEKAYHFKCQDDYAASFIENLRCAMNEIIEDTIVNHKIIDWTGSSREVKVLRCAVDLIENKNNECTITTLTRDDLKPKKHKKNRKGS